MNPVVEFCSRDSDLNPTLRPHQKVTLNDVLSLTRSQIVKSHNLFSLELYLQNFIHTGYVPFLQNQFVQAAVEKPIGPVDRDSISELTFKVREEQIQLTHKNDIDFYLF